MPRACIASLTTYSRSIGPTAARPSPPRANGVRPEPFRCRSRSRPSGVDELAEQERPPVAEPRASTRRTGARRRPAPPGRRRRGRRCRPAAARPSGLRSQAGSRPSSAASDSLSTSSRGSGTSSACQGTAISASSRAKRPCRLTACGSVTVTPRDYVGGRHLAEGLGGVRGMAGAVRVGREYRVGAAAEEVALVDPPPLKSRELSTAGGDPRQHLGGDRRIVRCGLGQTRSDVTAAEAAVPDVVGQADEGVELVLGERSVGAAGPDAGCEALGVLPQQGKGSVRVEGAGPGDVGGRAAPAVEEMAVADRAVAAGVVVGGRAVPLEGGDERGASRAELQVRGSEPGRAGGTGGVDVAEGEAGNQPVGPGLQEVVRDPQPVDGAVPEEGALVGRATEGLAEDRDPAAARVAVRLRAVPQPLLRPPVECPSREVGPGDGAGGRSAA